MWGNGGSGAGVLLERYCRVPDSFLDVDMAELCRSELVVYLYICRRTVGFDKRCDAISLRQFMDGIVTRDGRRLDFGTGLSRKAVLAALGTLVSRRLIYRHSRYRASGARISSVYELNLEGFATYRASTASESETFYEDFLPFDYLDDEMEEPLLPGEANWPEEAGRDSAPLPEPLPPTAGSLSLSSPVVESGPTPVVESTPTPVVESAPGVGVKSIPTINSSNQNKVNQNKANQNTLLQKTGLNKSGLVKESPFGRECDEVEQILLVHGVWSGLAVQIARQTIINGRHKDYLEGWLKWMAGQTGIGNEGAYLVKIIQGNADPPDPASEKAVRANKQSANYQEDYRRRTQKLADSLRKMGLKVPEE